ncbi:MAG: hypothetical protein P8Z30_14835 [Acidobacteriota bacterium]
MIIQSMRENINRMAFMRKTRSTSWVLLAVLLFGVVSAAAAVNPPDAVKPCKDAKNKMDDVYCIGQRRVAHRSIISLQKEIAIGKKYAEQIDRSAKLVKDPVITEYVNRVEQNIAQNSDAKVPITVRVIDSPTINAETLPGGFIFVDTGLLHAASSEARLPPLGFKYDQADAASVRHDSAHFHAHVLSCLYRPFRGHEFRNSSGVS